METVNQVIDQEQEQVQETRTYTQDEIDRAISVRLKREREKYADYEDLKKKAARLDEIEEANKTELQKATERSAELQRELDGMKRAAALREMRDAVAAETGVPATLLTADTEDGCRAQAEAALSFAKANNAPSYPNVRDAGEVSRVNSTGSTRDKFAKWVSDNF